MHLLVLTPNTRYRKSGREGGGLQHRIAPLEDTSATLTTPKLPVEDISTHPRADQQVRGAKPELLVIVYSGCI